MPNTIRRYVSIDPGVPCGVALWKDNLHDARMPIPHGTYVLGQEGSEATHRKRSIEMYEELRDLLQEFAPDKGWVEWPAYFGSDGGRATAKSGSLVKLCFAAGLCAAAVCDAGAAVDLTPVNDWKGQCSKATINRRIRKRYDRAGMRTVYGTLNSHMWDAVGIYLYHKGIL